MFKYIFKVEYQVVALNQISEELLGERKCGTLRIAGAVRQIETINPAAE